MNKFETSDATNSKRSCARSSSWGAGKLSKVNGDL